MTAEPAWMRPQRRRWPLLAVALLAGAVLVLFWRLEFHKSFFALDGTWQPDISVDATGKHAAVASDAPLCSQMGVDVLQRGGNAADAAVVVALCVGVVDPQSSGIGGGGFITVRLPNGTAFVVDAREIAPRNSSKHMFDADLMLSKYHGLASGVPGEVAGLSKLHEIGGGKLDWSSLVDPVAELSDHGFALGDATARMAQLFPDMFRILNRTAHFDHLVENSHWCWLFGDHTSCAHVPESQKGYPEPGAWIRRPELARTLRAIAKGGAKAMHHGAIPKSLVAASRKAGGVLTEEDFADYEVVVREALHGEYNGLHFVTAPEPASGPPLVLGLRVMEALQRERNMSTVSPETRAHRLIEVMKWMAAARSELGDPAYISNPKIAEIGGAEWAARVLGNISDAHTLDSWRDYHPSYEMNNPHGTTHFSIVDKDGMAVSMTSTVNLLFGNGVCDPETGIIMNSEMDDFSTPVRRNLFELAPSVYNFVEPGKRPLSSSVPLIMYDDDGKVQLVAGAAGGSRILTSVFQAVCRIYGVDATSALEAVAFPRIHHQLIPEVVTLEPGFDEELTASLESKGHAVEVVGPRSALNFVHRDDDGLWHAVSDFYRKGGMGAAY